MQNNLITLVVFPGGYNGRTETRLEWSAGVETIDAIRPVLIGNVVAGSERAGYRIQGEPCRAETNLAIPWQDNTVHSALIGVYTLPEQADTSKTCISISNFTVSKTWDFGVYHNTIQSVEFNGIRSVDNKVGLMALVIGPASLSHAYANKYIDVQDSTFIGTSSGWDCDVDTISTSSFNYVSSGSSRGIDHPNGGGKFGVVLPTFLSSSNKAPLFPWRGMMSYQSLYGLMTVSGKGGNTISRYCTSTKCHYLFNFTIFTDPEDVLDLICMKYYEISINLGISSTE